MNVEQRSTPDLLSAVALVGGLFYILVQLCGILLLPFARMCFKVKLVRLMYLMRTKTAVKQNPQRKHAGTILRMDKRQQDFIN